MTGLPRRSFPYGVWVAMVLAGCSCGEDAPDQKAEADAGTDAEPNDAYYRLDLGGGDVADSLDGKHDSQCTPYPIPLGVPEGWVEYPVFDCGYRFYVPSSEAYLPPPLEWEECTDEGPDPYQCRRLRMNSDADESVGGHSDGYVESDGRVVLQFRRIRSDIAVAGTRDFLCLVVEADGPVRQAILAKGLDGNITQYWAPGELGIAPGKVLWTLSKWDISTSPKSIEWLAVIGGNDRDLAPSWIFDRSPDAGAWTHAHTGPNEWIEAQGHTSLLHGWDGTEYGVIWKSAEDYGTGWATIPVWVGSTVFWEGLSSAYSWIWSWTKEAGSRRLVSYGPDTSRAVASFGADEKDMVWVEGKDRQPAGWGYPTQSIMAAPFTADPEALQPRRLRSWQGYSITDGHPVVGCGYAAFFHGVADITEQLLIVRLSDGVSWVLRNPDGRPWAWGNPLAVTCEEVFARTSEGIRRIRLDSLGPGLPPD